MGCFKPSFRHRVQLWSSSPVWSVAWTVETGRLGATQAGRTREATDSPQKTRSEPLQTTDVTLEQKKRHELTNNTPPKTTGNLQPFHTGWVVCGRALRGQEDEQDVRSVLGRGINLIVHDSLVYP